MRNRFKDLREDRDLKQKEVAIYLNISQQQYRLYETGVREIPIKLAIKLAKYYNVSLDYIFYLVDKKN